jgi:hypothetical protein
VINTAAFHKTYICEEPPDTASFANAQGALNVAKICSETSAKDVLISLDMLGLHAILDANRNPRSNIRLVHLRTAKRHCEIANGWWLDTGKKDNMIYASITVSG